MDQKKTMNMTTRTSCTCDLIHDIILDVLIYALWTAVLEDLMMAHVCISNGLQKRTWTKAEKSRKREADAITGTYLLLVSMIARYLIYPTSICWWTEEEADDLILQHTANIILVKSFSHARKQYTLRIDEQQSTIESCTCPDYRLSKGICKHMFLIHRLEALNLPFQQKHTTSQPVRQSSQTTVATLPQQNTRELELNSAIAR